MPMSERDRHCEEQDVWLRAASSHTCLAQGPKSTWGCYQLARRKFHCSSFASRSLRMNFALAIMFFHHHVHGIAHGLKERRLAQLFSFRRTLQFFNIYRGL